MFIWVIPFILILILVIVIVIAIINNQKETMRSKDQILAKNKKPCMRCQAAANHYKTRETMTKSKKLLAGNFGYDPKPKRTPMRQKTTTKHNLVRQKAINAKNILKTSKRML